MGTIKSWILLVILFVVCVVFITPTFLVDHLAPIIEYILRGIVNNEGSNIAIILQTFFAPLMVLIFNSGILPLFIDFIAYLEGH